MKEHNNDSILEKIKKAEDDARQRVESANKKACKIADEKEQKALFEKEKIIKNAQEKAQKALETAKIESKKQGESLIEKAKLNVESFRKKADQKKSALQDVFSEELLKLN
ncbi:MAG: hypothetical protein DRN66_01055 [Candidatus Nanohalarchaeota archaeon]|nr:MAG: hypothetical protein DRN66_01055 [Candidatus Nanohaloarchaeota archaeon]